MKKKIAIIGGGASGIAAARALAQNFSKEVDFVIYEKNNRAGGKSLSKKINNKIYELGSGLIVPPIIKTPFYQALKESNVTLENARKYDRAILYYSDGNGYKSMEQFSFKSSKSTAGLLRYVLDVTFFVIHQVIFDLTRKLGRFPKSKYLSSPLSENYGIWFINKFAHGMQGFGYVDSNNSQLCPSTYYYHDYFDFRMLLNKSVIVLEGTQQIWLNLIKKFNLKVELGVEVKSIRTDGDYLILQTSSGDEKFDFVINTLPLPEATSILEKVDHKQQAMINKVSYNYYITVIANLKGIENLASFNLDAMLSNTTLGDTMFVYKRSEDSQICTLNLVLPNGNMSDQEIIDSVNNSLRRSFNASIPNVNEAQVFRWSHYFGHLDSQSLSDGWFEKFENEIQGKNNTLYVGSGLHFESLEQSYNFSYKKVKEFFKSKLA